MKPFIYIATPHKDILEGKLTMDVFAADLWQVANGKAPQEYQDPDVFFGKTYQTKGLKNILDMAKNRLDGKTGDSTIQLQTPFGGGKTHTLIALYHKAKEWDAKTAVLDGTALNPRETKPWEEIERQLIGKVGITKGDTAPGKEKLINLISNNQPVLILIDEVLEYATKAAGIKVGDSNLASQTLAFLQELTGAVSITEKALVVIALPASVLEHYDENAEKLYQRLQKIIGRAEKIYTPVEEDEIESVIRKRLFQNIDESGVKKVIDEFVDYAQREGLILGDEAAAYREKFLKSFPFRPEVIDVLYKRWGSFPTFQRTRGVLRLLSLIVYDLINSKLPFIRLGDFDLRNDGVRRELIKHIGQEYDSIIAQDITSKGSGAKKVDDAVGTAYKPYRLGTTVATTVFMLSFSGVRERGGSIREVKLLSSHPDFPSSIIDTALNKLKETLFYLSDEGLYFTNQPNMNRILIVKEENITQEEIIENEKALLEKHLSGKNSKFSIYTWPKSHRDIPDTKDLKLIIVKDTKVDRTFLEKHGESPRVYRNTMTFLCIDDNQQENFYRFIRRTLALKSIEKEDKKLNLSDSQKKEIKSKIKSSEERVYEEIRKYYRRVFVPSRDGFREIDLGVPTFGGESYIDNEIYNILRDEGEILEKLAPAVLKEKYLKENDWVEITKILDAFFTTPGEMRIVSADVLKHSIKEGVKNGYFGLGYIMNDTPECRHFKEQFSPEFIDNEIIIKTELCKKGIEETEEKLRESILTTTTPIEKTMEVKETPLSLEYRKIHLKLNTPTGRISDIVRVVNYLKSLFKECAVKIEIDACNGSIKIADYENKIEEALRQAEIGIEEEKKE